MDEYEYYKPIGEWLIEKKGCQKNDYISGYTLEPEIRIKDTGTRKPDVVGVHYSWSGNTQGSQDFHHYVVEVKANVEPGSIDTLIGQINSDRYYVKEGNVAADKTSYYAAIPATEIPPTLQKQTADNGIGILTLQSVGSSDDVVVREKQLPTPVATNRTGVLSNEVQRSKGNFETAIKNTAVLSRLMRDPGEFFEEEIKTRQEQYRKSKNREKFVQYIQNRGETKEIAKETLAFLEGINQVTVSPPSSDIKKKPSLEIKIDGETKAELTPQKRNFKIHDESSDLLFRIEGRGDILSNVEGVETFSEVKSWLKDSLLIYHSKNNTNST